MGVEERKLTGEEEREREELNGLDSPLSMSGALMVAVAGRCTWRAGGEGGLISRRTRLLLLRQSHRSILVDMGSATARVNGAVRYAVVRKARVRDGEDGWRFEGGCGGFRYVAAHLGSNRLFTRPNKGCDYSSFADVFWTIARRATIAVQRASSYTLWCGHAKGIMLRQH